MVDSSGSFFCENKNFGCPKSKHSEDKLASHQAICKYKHVPCELAKCNQTLIPLNDFPTHLKEQHEYQVDKSSWSSRGRFRISYQLEGTRLIFKNIIWRCFAKDFIPVGRFINEEFSFGVIRSFGIKPSHDAFEAVVRITTPKEPKSRQSGQETYTFQVPVTPLTGTPNGLEASACVSLKKHLLRMCSKRIENPNGQEEWHWDVKCQLMTSGANQDAMDAAGAVIDLINA
ncbi:unnamed protein product [Allacma fusca]|uniref:Uncharacterized protein n=1 Tax=Allacma fusca TaxID=39272 RepID=A0A8J2P1C4_9HEXA|nr:unnamed protein product [Allacma fusca]